MPDLDSISPEWRNFVAPEPHSQEVSVSHFPYSEVSTGKPFVVTANIAGVVNSSDKITLELRSFPRWRNIVMQNKGAGKYIAEVPGDAVTPGLLNYRIVVQKFNNDTYVFPGNHKGDPYAWDNANNDTWQTIVADDKSGLDIFNTNADRANILQYNPDWRNNTIRFVPGDRSSELATRITAKNLTDKQTMGFQFYGDKLKGRTTELSSFKQLVIRVRSESPVKAKLSLITIDAFCFSANFSATNEWTDIKDSVEQLTA